MIGSSLGELERGKMTWINYSIFAHKWLERARRGNVSIDDADRFISLWIAFNGWMKCKYGENERERRMVERVKKSKDIAKVFSDLQKSSHCFSEDLAKLSKYAVADMRDINNTIRYDGAYETFIEVIYRIRCNLFHGRKDLGENEKDFELVCLSYRILLPLFEKILDEAFS